MLGRLERGERRAALVYDPRTSLAMTHPSLSQVSGDPVKFGLGLVSIVYDGHLCLDAPTS